MASSGWFSRQGGVFGPIRFRNSNSATLKNMVVGTVSLNPASIATQVMGSVAFTLTGARAGDMILMQPPTTVAATDGLGFAGAEVTANDTVTVYLANVTVGAVDGAARTWRYVWLDLT